MTLADKHVKARKVGFVMWVIEKGLILILVALVIWTAVQLLGPAFMYYIWPQIVAIF